MSALLHQLLHCIDCHYLASNPGNADSEAVLFGGRNECPLLATHAHQCGCVRLQSSWVCYWLFSAHTLVLDRHPAVSEIWHRSLTNPTSF